MTSLIRRQNQTISPFNIFESFFNDPFFTSMSPWSMMTGTDVSMPIDVSETDTHVLVRASLPGFTKDQVTAEVHDGVLSISANAEESSEDSGERFFRRERQWRSVSRQIALPVAVDENGAQAELANGVLTLRLPKSAKAQTRKIRIS
jgi:HSP20 family protein